MDLAIQLLDIHELINIQSTLEIYSEVILPEHILKQNLNYYQKCTKFILELFGISN